MTRITTRWRTWWDSLHDEHADFIDNIPPEYLRVALFAASTLTLYAEMVLVRWHASCFHAYPACVFVLNALCFIPLGPLAARLMTRLPRLTGYSLNLLGSLAGIGLFFVLSLAWTGPGVWLGLAALLAAPFLVGHRRTTAV